MTEHEFLTSTDLLAMLNYLRKGPASDSAKMQMCWEPLISDRQLRLWVEACRVAAGKYGCAAYNLNKHSELKEAYQFWALTSNSCVSKDLRCHILRDIVGNPHRLVDPEIKLRCENCNGTKSRCEYELCADRGCNGWMKEKREESWLTPTVRKLAQTIHDTGDFSAMPILWDALEDAGCTNEDVRRHCMSQERCPNCQGDGDRIVGGGRGNGDRYYPPVLAVCKDCKGTGYIPMRGPHVRGCWVITLILGEA